MLMASLIILTGTVIYTICRVERRFEDKLVRAEEKYYSSQLKVRDESTLDEWHAG